MKQLIKQYLDHGISRRQLVSGLSALGMSSGRRQGRGAESQPARSGRRPTAAAARRRRSATSRATAARCSWRSSRRPASSISSSILRPATIRSSTRSSMCPRFSLIKGIQEGAVVAMADGYARASGRTGVVVVANIGLPNAMTQMVNTYKDQIPLLVAVASIDQDALGRDQLQEPDHHELMTEPITKWFWQAQSTAAIAETTRRALKFASTPPCGPVFLSLPTNTLAQHAKAQVWERSKFDVPMRIRPDKDDIEKAARMLIEAKNPLLSIGDEITWCRGEKELVELAELLGVPVAGQTGGRSATGRSRSRPGIRSIIGTLLRTMRYPGQARRAAQSRQPLRRARFARHQADLDPARSDQPRPRGAGRSRHGGRPAPRHRRSRRGDPQHGDRVAAQGRSPTSAPRARRAYSAQMARRARRRSRAGLADSTPISMERLGLELEANLDRDTCYVTDVDSGKTMDPLMSFGGDDKPYFGTGPNVLGWGMAAGVRRQAGAARRAGGLRRRRRQLLLLGPAAVVEHGALQGAGDRDRAQQPQLQQRAQPHLERRRPAIRGRARHDLLQRRSRRRFCQGRRRVRRRRRDGEGAGRAQGRALLAPKARRSRDGPICSTSTSSAKALARCRNGIRPIRSPICAHGRCDHAYRVVRFSRACRSSPPPSPSRAQNANPLPPGDGRDLVAVACSQCHYLGTIAKIRDGAAGWRRLCRQHGAARRAIDAGPRSTRW